MGIIVDLNTRTVQGFGFPGVIDYPVNITGANDAIIAFQGSGEFGTLRSSTLGSIDRVTGEVRAFIASNDLTTGNLISTTTYVLQCKPAQRVF